LDKSLLKRMGEKRPRKKEKNRMSHARDQKTLTKTRKEKRNREKSDLSIFGQSL